MFSEQDRRVFDYQDGTRDSEGNVVTVYADPLEIEQAMSAALGGDVNGVIDRTHEFSKTDVDDDDKPRRLHPPEVVHENSQRLAGAIRKAFGLEPFNRLSGRGATGAMCLAIWNRFVEWSESQGN